MYLQFVIPIRGGHVAPDVEKPTNYLRYNSLSLALSLSIYIYIYIRIHIYVCTLPQDSVLQYQTRCIYLVVNVSYSMQRSRFLAADVKYGAHVRISLATSF